MSGALTPAQARTKHAAAFSAFYSAYPKHTGINEAARVFADLCEKGTDPVQLISAAREYALRVGSDLTYVPSPHSWLKKGNYLDADLFTDEKGAEKNWLVQCWKTVNIKAVENKYHISYPKTYPPDDMTDPAAIDIWFQATGRAWIDDVYREKIECQSSPSPIAGTSPAPGDSLPTTPEQSDASSAASFSTPQSSLS